MKMNLKSVLNNLFVILAVSVISLNSALSQEAGGDGDLDGLVSDTKSDLMMVVGGGLAGAILGLSTLSFVDEPKDHTRNIMVGAAIGIIAGVGYVAFSQAGRSKTMVYGEEEEASINFDTKNRKYWHASVHNELNPILDNPTAVAVSFRY